MERLAEIIRILRQGQFPCLFHIITGAYCPGCGGTRAVISLIHGNILKSILYHPFVFYTVVTCPVLLLYWIHCKRKKKQMRYLNWKWILYTGLGILIINFAVKNYVLLACHVDLLALLDGNQ